MWRLQVLLKRSLAVIHLIKKHGMGVTSADIKLTAPRLQPDRRLGIGIHFCQEIFKMLCQNIELHGHNKYDQPIPAINRGSQSVNSGT